MNKTGQSASSLSERLSAKLEQDRKQIEELTLSEHKKLAENFLNASKAEFDTIRSAIQEQSKTTAQTLGVMLRWPLWTAAGCIVIVLTALVTLWAGTTWGRSELSEIRAVTATERQTLLQLQNQTGQIRIINSEKGTFLILPKSAENGWTCGESKTPCIKLPQPEANRK